ncbi:unnamed protein product [Bursaphelenchus okinawaensis]|uniref:Uncharacterized protein n=1 Tax=Bursaphelenchus okinawaensis TaxID=465554 RepID=A0A811KHG8_9BILA|nr:unnamed protein product [Bursaphelenchus okinawaensis]CAG9103264.1 unnamed protein product [Bursaphelenchus okinawaensis]
MNNGRHSSLRLQKALERLRNVADSPRRSRKGGVAVLKSCKLVRSTPAFSIVAKTEAGQTLRFRQLIIMNLGVRTIDLFLVVSLLGILTQLIHGAALVPVQTLEDSELNEDKRAGGRAFLASEDKRGGGRAFQFNSKRGGGRAFQDVEEKRGGARAFLPVDYKRGGGRAFSGFANDGYYLLNKRGGGRAFYGGFNYGNLYAPSFPLSYEKKADYVPYYLTEMKRAGGRAFQPRYYDPYYWYADQSKRAGGRSFPISDESKRMLEEESRLA